jgi:hypothetical protein
MKKMIVISYRVFVLHSVFDDVSSRARNEAKNRRGASLRFVPDEAKPRFEKVGRSEARRSESLSRRSEAI